MTTSRAASRELDRLSELAALGGALAGAALGDLFGIEVTASAPRLLEPLAATQAGRWDTGIVFDVDGDVAGLLAIVLSESQCERAVERLLGCSEVSADRVESALRELGNIIASHTVSAIADARSATVLLSVPTLALHDAGAVLGALIAERQAALRFEIDLAGADGSEEALLVFVPEPRKAPPL
jgi:chemotaxis protein CheY-P-specific phosphatase CheC